MSADAHTPPLGKGDPGPPGPLGPPPVPTCDQAGRFFALLCDMGYADALDRLHATDDEAPAIDYTKPRTSVGEAAAAAVEEEANALDEPVVRLDLGAIFREVGHHNAYGRLASIIWGVPEEEAGGIPVEAVRDAFFPFAVACSSPLAALSDFVLDWA